MAVRRWPPSVMPITSRRVTPVRCRFQTTVRVVPVPAPFPDHGEGAPGPSHLGTGETADLNWQEEARGLAGSVPTNAQGPGDSRLVQNCLPTRGAPCNGLAGRTEPGSPRTGLRPWGGEPAPGKVESLP